MSDQKEANCDHVWVSNSGMSGEPIFRENRQLSDRSIMHVICAECSERTWFTEEQWWISQGGKP